jgi:hypothetical protein
MAREFHAARFCGGFSPPIGGCDELKRQTVFAKVMNAGLADDHIFITAIPLLVSVRIRKKTLC